VSGRDLDGLQPWEGACILGVEFLVVPLNLRPLRDSVTVSEKMVA
jgi:hypothetical protein